MEKIQTFNSNLSPFILIMNGVISFQLTEERRPIYFRVPTLEDSLENYDYQLFINLMYSEPSHYEKIKFGFVAKSKGEYILGFLMYSQEYGDLLKKYLLKYVLNSKANKYGLSVDGLELNAAELEYIANVIIVSSGFAKIDELIETEEDKKMKEMSEMEQKLYLRQKETEERLRRAKERKQKSDSSEDITQEKIVTAIMHEFNFTIDQIKKMNYFGIGWYFNYAFQLDYHKVMQYAAGAGNLGKNAKYKHWLK